MKLLIVEPEATGHRMALYVRLVVRAAQSRGWTVSLLTTHLATKHPAFQLVCNEANNQLSIHFMDFPNCNSPKNALSLIKRQYNYYKSLKKAFFSLDKKEIPDLVYISCLDYFDKVMALLGTPFGEVPLSGLLVSVKFHRYKVGIGPKSRSDIFYKWLFQRTLEIKTMKRILVIDEAFVNFASQSKFALHKKLALIPDAGEINGNESKETARNGIGIPQNAFIVLVYGSLSERKGIKELLNAVARQDAPANLRILLAGTPDQVVQSFLETAIVHRLRAQKILVERLFFHDDRDEYRVFRAADAVWLGYVGGSYGSSGVLYQAGSLGLPLIATSRGMIGWLTERHCLGKTIDPTNPESVIRAICELCNDPIQWHKFSKKGMQYASKHTGQKFGDVICEQLSLSYAYKNF